MPVFRLIVLLFLVVFASGCTVSPIKSAKPTVPAESTVIPPPQHERLDDIKEKKKSHTPTEVMMPNVLKSTTRQQISPVIQKMLTRINGSLNNENYADATSLLERALRIDPKNPLLWYKLARVKLAERNYAQAKQMAVRSNQYVQSDVQLREKNQRIIDQAIMLSSEGG